MDNILTYKYTNWPELTEDDFYCRLGHHIKNLRIKYGYTQKQVADYLSVSHQQIQKYEKGKNRIPTRFIIKLMDLFKVDIHEILGQKDPNEDLREALTKLEEKQNASNKKHDKDIQELKDILKELISKQNAK